MSLYSADSVKTVIYEDGLHILQELLSAEALVSREDSRRDQAFVCEVVFSPGGKKN